MCVCVSQLPYFTTADPLYRGGGWGGEPPPPPHKEAAWISSTLSEVTIIKHSNYNILHDLEISAYNISPQDQLYEHIQRYDINYKYLYRLQLHSSTPVH